MSHLTERSETDIEERFHISGRRPVQFLLAGLAEQREPFTVLFNHGKEHFYTMLLAAQPEGGKLIFDCSGSPEINRQLLYSDHNVFIGRPGGVQVKFSTGRAAEVLHAGAKAFLVALPDFVLRLQRRESFRIETPHARPLQFFGRLPDGKSFNLPTYDISCSGIGLTSSTPPPDGLSTGLHLNGCRFTLPEESRDFFVDAVVQHITQQEGRHGPQWRIGLAFAKISHAEENRIQRYIAKVEHERRELS